MEEQIVSGLDPTQGINDSPQTIFNEPETQGPEAEPISFKEVFDNRLLENHVVPNLIRTSQNNKINENIDPEFEATGLTYDRIQKDLQERGLENIPSYKLTDLANTQNEVSYQHTLNRIEEWNGHQQELQQLGGLKALAAEIASYATDPVAAAAEGAVALKTTGTLLKRFLVSGGRGVLVDSMIEGVRATDEAIDPKDFAIGAATSFIVSGGLGALTGSQVKAVNNLKEELKKGDDVIGDVGAALNRGAEEVDPNIQLPSELTSDILKDKIIDEGILESKWLNATYSVRAQGQKVNYEPLRKLNEIVHGVAIKADNDAVRPLSAIDRANLLEGKADSILQNVYSPEFASWAKEIHGKGVITRQFSADIQQEFSESIGKHLLTGNVDDVAPQVLKAADGFRSYYKNLAETLEASGVVPKNTLTKNSDFGMPRIMSYPKARAIQKRYGRGVNETIEKLISEGIEKARLEKGLEFDPKLTEIVAKAYRKRAFTPPAGDGAYRRSDNVLGLDLDDRQFIDELLEGQSLEDIDEVTRILDDLKKTEGSSDTPRLEKRLPLDLNVQTKMFDGQVLKLSDLFEDDAQKVAYNYGKWASAESALAEHGLSLKKLDDLHAELSTKAAANTDGNLKNSVIDADVKDLEFTMRAMKGLSVETDPNSMLNRLGRVAMAHSYITKMGQSGFNAITEAGTVLAAGQLKNLFKGTNILRKLVKDVVSGNISDEYLRQVHMLSSGLGDTWVRNTASLKHVAETTTKHNDGLSKVEAFVEGAKRVATASNGLSHITDVTRRLSAVQAMDMLDSLANGRKLSKSMQRRLKDWTLSDKRKSAITDYLLHNGNIKRGRAGELTDIGLQGMPDDITRYIEEFIYAFSSHNIQQTTKSNLPKAFQHPLGRLLLQFRSFTAGAWENHVLSDLSHRDSLALQKLVFTGSLGMAMYAARTHLNYIGQDKKRKELVTVENMLRSGATYAVNTALIPDLVDTVARPLLGGPVVGRKRTSGLDSSFSQLSVPAGTVLNDTKHIANIPGDLISGRGFSKEQLKAIFAVSMLDAFWPSRSIRNNLSEDLISERQKE